MDLDVVDPELLSQRTQPNPSQGVVPPADQPRGQALVGLPPQPPQPPQSPPPPQSPQSPPVPPAGPSGSSGHIQFAGKHSRKQPVPQVTSKVKRKDPTKSKRYLFGPRVLAFKHVSKGKDKKTVKRGRNSIQ